MCWCTSVLVWQWRSCLLPAVHRHPERQRRILVHGDSDSLDSKYQSAGRHQTGRRQTSDGRRFIPESKRVQAPSAPRFYRSCAGALTDGFRPKSGLVQRGVFMLPSAAPPLVAGATTFPHGKASHTILRSLALPCSTAITDSQYFVRRFAPTKYVC